MKDKSYHPKSDKEISWLVESLLHAQDTTTLPFQRIPEHGALFPFSMDDLTISALTKNPKIEIFRHGMNEQLIGLVK